MIFDGRCHLLARARIRKFTGHEVNALITELTNYVLISLDIARVEHFRLLDNGGWEARFIHDLSGALHLDNFEISVPITEIYEDIAIES